MGTKQFRAELYKEHKMTTVHCTHSDGSDCEGRFALSVDYLKQEFEADTGVLEWPAWPIYERDCSELAQETEIDWLSTFDTRL